MTALRVDAKDAAGCARRGHASRVISRNAVQVMLNAHLVELYASRPARAAMVIITGHSHPRWIASLKFQYMQSPVSVND